MEDGTRRLVGSVAANAAAVAFPIIYLITAIAGCSWSTSFLRALGGALLARFPEVRRVAEAPVRLD